MLELVNFAFCLPTIVANTFISPERKFSCVERKIFDAVLSKLEEPVRGTFLAQLEGVNWVDRAPDSTKTAFHRLAPFGERSLSRETFVFEKPVERLARCRITIGEQKIAVRLFCANGVFRTCEYSSPLTRAQHADATAFVEVVSLP